MFMEQVFVRPMHFVRCARLVGEKIDARWLRSKTFWPGLSDAKLACTEIFMTAFSFMLAHSAVFCGRWWRKTDEFRTQTTILVSCVPVAVDSPVLFFAQNDCRQPHWGAANNLAIRCCSVLMDRAGVGARKGWSCWLRSSVVIPRSAIDVLMTIWAGAGNPQPESPTAFGWPKNREKTNRTSRQSLG